jgi:SAM-dependent methyltransferase
MDWFETKNGKELLSLEQSILDQLFDHIFGYNIIQYGDFESLIKNSRFKNKFTLNEINFKINSMPFEGDSIDCIVLPHQDLEDEMIISEIYRALIPHGHAIFINFNPWSYIGLKTFFSFSNEYPWNQNLESFTSFQNKILKNEFEIVNGKFFAYNPFLKFSSINSSWDKIGDRWFPFFANIYLIVARKKITPMTPIKPGWKNKYHKNQIKIKSKYEI